MTGITFWATLLLFFWLLHPGWSVSHADVPTPSGSAAGIAFDGHALWVSGYDSGYKIYKIDPVDGTELAQFPAPYSTSTRDMSWGGDELWGLSSSNAGKVYKFDTTTGEIDFTLPTGLTSIYGIAWDGASLWLSETSGDTLNRVNPASAARWRRPSRLPT